MLAEQRLLKPPFQSPAAKSRAAKLRTLLVDAQRSTQWGFAEFFLISQAVLPALLYLPGSQAIRVEIRMAPFAISLIALLVYGRKRTLAPVNARAQKWLLISILYLIMMLFHPTTNSFLAGVAQIMLYLSVMAPMFWAPQIRYTPQRVQRLLFIILICSGINSLVGVLQVYDPGTWMPKDVSSIVKSQEGYLDSLSYVRPDGTRVLRPSGLSDAPGAVSGPAILATVLGLIFCFGPVNAWKRAIAMVSGVLGLAAIFLSQVRTSLLMACGALLVYAVLLALQKQKVKALVLLAGGSLAVFWSLSLALALGGESIQERFATLVEDDPVTVYYDAHRGDQLEYGLTSMVLEYPGGAGLARWGMMRYYFGDPNNADSPMIFSELQPNSWILDGGIVLLLAYCIALFLITYDHVLVARRARTPDLRFIAAAILAVNAVTVALIFGYTPFTTQVGMQYWFLCGVLCRLAANPTI